MYSTGRTHDTLVHVYNGDFRLDCKESYFNRQNGFYLL